MVKKPKPEKTKVKKSIEMKKEKSDHLTVIFNRSNHSKNVGVIQRDKSTKDRNEKKETNNKKSEITQINTSEINKVLHQNNIIISLSESEIILPDMPLDEDKKPNSNFSKNLVENISENQKS